MTNPTPLPALLPCPFCGDYDPEENESTVPTIRGGKKRAVYCNGCFAEGSPADTPAAAIEAWNRRAALGSSMPSGEEPSYTLDHIADACVNAGINDPMYESLAIALEDLGRSATQPTASTYTYAANLARAIFESEYSRDPDYASGKVKWDVCDTTAGVLTQIDNMVSGMSRTKTAAVQGGLTDERKEFEADYLRRFSKPGYLGRGQDGEYGHFVTRARWEGWQARAALSANAGSQQSERERERCAQCCDDFAAMMENGAGEVEPGQRFRQLARKIRAGEAPLGTAKHYATPKEAGSQLGEPIYQRVAMQMNDWTDVSKEEYALVGALHRRIVYQALDGRAK